MTRTMLPDVLTRFPVSSLALWRHAKSMPRRGRHYEITYEYIMARVVGKTPNQGQKRLSLDVCYIGSNVTGKNVLYVKHLTSVSVENVIPLAKYMTMRQAVGVKAEK
jgi:hypothetical protein